MNLDHQAIYRDYKLEIGVLMPSTLETVIYTAHVRTIGGREGRSVSDDSLLDVILDIPVEMGGSGRATNPEQLFAAAYSACFMNTMIYVANLTKVSIPKNSYIDASVSIGAIPHGFGIEVKLQINLPGMERNLAKEIIDTADLLCPYSNATRGNITVEISMP